MCGTSTSNILPVPNTINTILLSLRSQHVWSVDLRRIKFSSSSSLSFHLCLPFYLSVSNWIWLDTSTASVAVAVPFFIFLCLSSRLFVFRRFEHTSLMIVLHDSRVELRTKQKKTVSVHRTSNRFSVVYKHSVAGDRPPLPLPPPLPPLPLLKKTVAPATGERCLFAFTSSDRSTQSRSVCVCARKTKFQKRIKMSSGRWCGACQIFYAHFFTLLPLLGTSRYEMHEKP